MPVLILGTAATLAVSMSATAEPITAHLVLTIEGGVAESEVTPLFGPLHAGDTLNAVITFDPGRSTCPAISLMARSRASAVRSVRYRCHTGRW